MHSKKIFFALLLLLPGLVNAQCTTPVSVFPFNETFEATNGGWFAGGLLSDWAWGAPVKNVITAAGEGSKCWTTGGLTGSTYNGGERSWVQSPCFDFSTLVHPRISFKIFWETEKGFDGADMQYSTDGVTVWNNLGAVNSNTNCNGTNWYNSANVTYIPNKPGWSGNIQTASGPCQSGNGNGSGGWLTASHDLTALAGQANVIFRFEFGAGTICNDYNGFAFDDVKIFEAPPNTSGFTFTCKPALTVDFTSNAACASSYTWNFGDPASATNNSTLPNPSHTFSGGGLYTVTLTTTFPSGPPSTVSMPVRVLDVAVNIDRAISCANGHDGIISAAGSGSNAPYSYVWNTNPVQSTPIITGLGATSYTVTVNSGTACPATATIVLAQPSPINSAIVIKNAKCTADNGAVFPNISGGTPPYNYLWSNGAVTPDITGLAAGIFSLKVTDSRGCIFNFSNINVQRETTPLTINLGNDAQICPGQKLILDPGFYSSYLWQDNSTSQTFTVTETGDYSVRVTDVNGCSGTDIIHVTVDCSDIYFPSAFTPDGDWRNEVFGPAGNNLSIVKNYKLSVFNRYGELVFESIDPYKKWNGRYKTKVQGNDNFVWMATYSINGKSRFQKGVVTLIK